MEDYIKLNKETWNNKTPFHIDSAFYNVEGFLKGKTSLHKPELALLGDVKGKKILHLQCHFGQDTISLNRMGATVTGIDLSDKAIAFAKELTKKAKAKAHFICCNLYDLPSLLNEKFDIVFTSYGTIGWLPDLDKWAKVIEHFLKPGGRLVMVDFHPIIWMFDDKFKEVAYNYFNTEAIVETSTGTYANRNAPIKTTSINWNHSLSEIIGSLLKNNLQLTHFDELNYSPYNCFLETEKLEEAKYVIKHLKEKIPMLYAIEAHKNKTT